MAWGSALEIAVVSLLGLIFGSFATALSWRVPRGLSWIGDISDSGKRLPARSSCTHCGNFLSFRDLIPVFSWFFLKGKCRHCGASIGIRYPLTEFLTLAGCLGVYFSWGFTVPAFIIMALLPLLAALLVIDIEHLLLPDQLVFMGFGLAGLFLFYQGMAVGFGAQFMRGIFEKGAAAIVFSGLVFLIGVFLRKILKKETLGFGDVKFFAMAGFWLGFAYLPFFLIFSGLAGIVIGAGYRIFLKKTLFPFGPALILALYASLLLMGHGIVPFSSTG